jgi:hypothetical protein
MKKINITALIVFIGLSLTFGFTYYRSQSSLSIKLNINDLPEDGIILVSPSDPNFDKEVDSLSNGNLSNYRTFIDDAKPFCVFIKNTGTRDIAGYRLKWELLKADDKVVTAWSAASAPDLLSQEEKPSRRVAMDGALPIKPNTTLFVSWESAIADLLYSSKNNPAGQTEVIIQNRDAIMSRLNIINQERKQSAVSATVTVDCVYFKDGTFVGPDTGNLFAATQGYIEAQLDLGWLVKQHIQEKKSSAELFDRIKTIADEPDVMYGSNLTASDYKNLYTKINARNILKIRDKGGDKSALEYTQQPLNKNWAKLQKKARHD